MKHLFVDTNIVLDLLAGREPFYPSAAALFTLADKNKVSLAASALSFANVNYVLNKEKPAKECRELLRMLKILVKVHALNDKVLSLALNDSSFNDLEDALQYYTAIENDQDVIITRDLKGFKKSRIPVMSAEQYLYSLSADH